MKTYKVERAILVDAVNIIADPDANYDSYVQINMSQAYAELVIKDLQRQLDQCLSDDSRVSVAAFGKKFHGT